MHRSMEYDTRGWVVAQSLWPDPNYILYKQTPIKKTRLPNSKESLHSAHEVRSPASPDPYFPT